MLEYSSDEVIAALSTCDNINAAVKSFLKRELKKGDPREKFTKDLRTVFQSNNTERQISFVEKHRERFEGVLLGITRYALYQPIDAITATIIEAHADPFNATYEVNDSEIEILNKEEFQQIARAALDGFRAGLAEHSLPVSNFMVNVLILTLFDDAVVPEIMQIAAAQ